MVRQGLEPKPYFSGTFFSPSQALNRKNTDYLIMTSQRIHEAVRDLEEIKEGTDVELEELGEAIHEVERLHKEHMQEMEKDKEFIKDMKDLYQEIRMINKIDQHMYKILEAYEGGKINLEAFKKKYMKDEKKFVEVIHEIRTELEEMIRLLSEEERLTDRDLDLEGATDELIRALNDQHEDLEHHHDHMHELLVENR